MDNRINLADPDFEPSDDQLRELSERAFAGVKAANERALARHRAEISAARTRVLEGLERKAKAERDHT